MCRSGVTNLFDNENYFMGPESYEGLPVCSILLKQQVILSLMILIYVKTHMKFLIIINIDFLRLDKIEF